jgi:hypothetical protein
VTAPPVAPGAAGRALTSAPSACPRASASPAPRPLVRSAHGLLGPLSPRWPSDVASLLVGHGPPRCGPTSRRRRLAGPGRRAMVLGHHQGLAVASLRAPLSSSSGASSGRSRAGAPDWRRPPAAAHRRVDLLAG